MADAPQLWGESGILRGKKPDEDGLLVFGYSCKLFRDDEKALFIDQGRHLIPWMGDESLKIDRYDGRAALSDLRHLEAGAGHHFDFLAGLSESERRVEALCDEERYRALHHSEDDEEMYHEEELKRLQQALAGQKNAYGAVQFAYDKESQRTVQVDPNTVSKEEEEDDTPFVAPPELDIPLNMPLPPSQKLHSIIERTAAFIAKQGGQMEVLIKAKQSGNAQFGFLSYDHTLHPYYRLLLNAIKSGRYRPKEPSNDGDQDGDMDDEDDDDHYLHPSLASSTKIDAAPAIPSIAYRPSADCAYSLLVNKIKSKLPPPPTPGTELVSGPAVTPASSLVSEVAPPVAPAAPVVRPPVDLQLVIEKMAAYVAKNGPDFEIVVRNKGDPRFCFLDPNHVYYAYYKHRMYELTPDTSSDGQRLGSKSADGRGPPAPVSFSIKTQSTGDVALETRSALDGAERPPRAGEAYMASALQRISDVPLPPCPPPQPEPPLNKEEQERRQAAAQRSKIVEERLKAKLMQAARERMASATKEKQIQQERKKKVAAFLSKLALEKRQIVVAKPTPIIGPQLPPELQPPPESADQDDVRSLPSPSPPREPSPPPAPTMCITPPPAPSIGSLEIPVPPRRPSSPKPSGERKRTRSPTPPYSLSNRHKHSNAIRRTSTSSSSSSKHHRPRSKSPSRRKHRRSPLYRSQRKKPRSSPSPSHSYKKHRSKRHGRSSSNSGSSSSSSTSKDSD